MSRYPARWQVSPIKANDEVRFTSEADIAHLIGATKPNWIGSASDPKRTCRRQTGDHVVKSYRPTSTSRFVTLSIGLPGIALFLWGGTKIFGQAPAIVACVFVAVGLALAVKVLFDLTLRVAMDAQSITRSWQFGSTVVPIKEIHRLAWGGARGVLILTIHYGAKRFMQISSNSLEKNELRAIHNDVLAALGLEGVPLMPRFAEYVGYVDIDETLKMSGR